LDKIAKQLFTKGLATSTQRTYSCGQKKYLLFCSAGSFKAIPATETVLCRFVASMAKAGLKHRTMKVYLSAVRFLHISEGAQDPFLSSLHRLRYILQGIKRSEAEKGIERRERLPITPSILRQIKAVWDSSASDPDVVMLWAACCLGFFGFLRSGEMTIPSDTAYDSSVHLSRSDIAVDDPGNPQTIRVRIKQSKTDPFRSGINLYLGKTSSDLCPVMALLNYLVLRGSIIQTLRWSPFDPSASGGGRTPSVG